MAKLRLDIRLTRKCAKKYRSYVKLLRGAKTVAARKKVLLGIEFGRNACALCARYNNVYDTEGNECRGCPVYAKTRKRFCVGTPYHQRRHHVERSLSWMRDELIGECGNDSEYNELVAQCEKEAVFLERILDDLEKQL